MAQVPEMTVNVKLGGGAQLVELAKVVLADPAAEGTAGARLAEAVLSSVRLQPARQRSFKAQLPDEVAKGTRRSAAEPANTEEWERRVAEAKRAKAAEGGK